MNKKILKNFNSSIIFLIVGGITAISSLLISITIEMFAGVDLQQSSYVFFNVFLEEAIKLIFLYFLFNLFFNKNEKNSEFIFFSFFLGLGFAIFEVSFNLFEGHFINIAFPIIILVLIHGITSVFLALAIWSFRRIKAINIIYSALWLVLALLIHLFYNLFAIRYN